MSLSKTVLQELPLNLRCHTDISVSIVALCSVSVLYCVLRPKTKDNS